MNTTKDEKDNTLKDSSNDCIQIPAIEKKCNKLANSQPQIENSN